jgi:hypothetical protein
MYPVMADSCSASALPAGLPAYAGYVDGRWPSFYAIVPRFGKVAHCVSITTQHNNARIIDCELGDATPETAARWLVDRVPTGLGGRWSAQFARQTGVTATWRPGVYFAAANRAAVLAAIKAESPGLVRSSFVLWEADWTGHPSARLPEGIDAQQYLNDADANVDYSSCGPNMFEGIGMASAS